MIETPETLPPTRPRRRWELFAIPVAALLGVAVAWTLFRPHVYTAMVLQAPKPATPLTGLVFDDGTPADLARYRGDVVLLYFGYTHCPDVCPTTLAAAARAREDLGSRADRVHVVMVTVDPARDTADVLGKYLRAFDPTFVGVTGSEEDVDRAAIPYGVLIQRGDGLEYTVDHTATLMGIDTEGTVRLVFPPDVTTKALASDLGALLK